MYCYFQGCSERGTTKEHIPPKAFFPPHQRNQLLTVKSCDRHNNKKSLDDLYVLAQICLNASPRNSSREIFLKSVLPQLGHNSDALRQTLLRDAQPLPHGVVKYKVDTARVDRFFTALSCGIIYKSCGSALPAEYTIQHVYHNFLYEAESDDWKKMKQALLQAYSGPLGEATILNFGHVNELNTAVYSAKIVGLSGFRGSITIVHEFYGIFRVTSMLTRLIGAGAE
jgi:hypothetical protein